MMKAKCGSSPKRLGKEGTENTLPHRPRGCIPPGAGQHRRENPRIAVRSVGFRKAPVRDPFAENRIVGQIGPTEVFSDANR